MELVFESERVPKLDSENNKQYFFFLEYLSMGRRRRLKMVAERFNCSERTIYAYAKKFDWVNRAKVEDKKERDKLMTEEQIRSEEIKLKKIIHLNDSQEIANGFIGSLARKTQNGDLAIVYTATNENFSVTERLDCINKVLRALECFTKISFSVDKQLKKLYDEEECELHTEESLLEQIDFYDLELNKLERSVDDGLFSDIFKEIEFIESKGSFDESFNEIKLGV